MQKIFYGLAVISCLTQPLAVFASDWFDRWDHNQDHHWSWQEYYAARRAWEREHREERRLSEAELRAEYAGLDGNHDHRLEREEAKAWGRW
jgi:hypothetical protein